MEHLPIVIFEIVLSVFIAFAVLAEILLNQIECKQKKIKDLEQQIEFLNHQYNELEKFVHSNTEFVSCIAELEPMYYEKDPKEYLDSLSERIGYELVKKMSETFKERMLERIKEILVHKRYGDFLRTEIMTLKPFKISVPIFRVDYDYIKLSDAEYIFR